ncbi:T9SS sorting signal type C domain-containing protein [Yeosuana sp.]|uniref:T9SS sorting signal type C domain-containing protein n=1 Tax=Yeosuana sp. TaxID=2529388 RepID=UPI004054D906
MLLDNPTTEVQNTLSVLLHNQVLEITANEGIDAVYVFDMTGKKLFTQKTNHENEVRIPFTYPQGIYIFKVILSDGTSHSKKLIQTK